MQRDGVAFSVYTLETDFWRQIEPLLFPYHASFRFRWFLLNDGLHWLAKKVGDGDGPSYVYW